ncbi:ABC transporter ATP-binding protein [Microlunatus soli]|uniref:Peptide/nickel transport system ATP-binding protein n=1 Tax=Microlunatus soli TaxID=630515 RepID=A0A1H1MCP3_9ACTN|nr:ABC transporter ATP-binding protein [Microlunatus soli]SDR84437.1 peptide/nickel transport system ATP-binding protein [Microlunatus soli]
MSEQLGARTDAPLMELKGVSQIFQTKRGERPAVRDVSLTVNAGEVLCVVGESGCGKTTTARMAAGLSKPTAGTVEFGGRDIWSMNKETFADFRTAVQYVHQDPYASLNPIRSVYKSLAAPLRKHGLAKSNDAAWEQSAELLRRVDLTPPESYLPKFPHQLSGGQRQRASVARALSLNPKLIIADESTSMLDVSIRVAMLNMLGRLRDDLGVGFLFITHDLAIAKYFGWQGRTAVMYLGRVVEYGPTQEVIKNPQHPYTRALLDAVPEPDPDLAAKKLPGGGLRSAEIPSLAALPSGCTFHPRCPINEEGLCEVEEPQLVRIGERREVSCHVVAREAGEHELDDLRGVRTEPASASGSGQ